MSTENDQHTVSFLTPEGSAAPVPRLRIVLEGPPADVLALLRSMAQPAKGKRGPKLNAEIAATIRRRLAAGESKEALAKELGVRVITIEHIRDGRSYPEAASA
jgi:hypothetical protein